MRVPPGTRQATSWNPPRAARPARSSEEIIAKPGMEPYLDAVFGFDETRVEHAMKVRGKEKQARTVRCLTWRTRI